MIIIVLLVSTFVVAAFIGVPVASLSYEGDSLRPHVVSNESQYSQEREREKVIKENKIGGQFFN